MLYKEFNCSYERAKFAVSFLKCSHCCHCRVINGFDYDRMDNYCFVIAVVIGAEMINTAIERVVDLASPELHPLAKEAKDLQQVLYLYLRLQVL